MTTRAAWIAALTLLAGAPAASAAVSEFTLGMTPAAEPVGIVSGPDSNLWVAEAQASRLARVTPAGDITEFTLPAGREPLDLAVLGGLVYFTERAGDRIGRINPAAGSDAAIQASIVEFAVPGAGSAPTELVAGSDGAVWFTQAGADQIGRITPAGTVTEFAVPGVGSAPAGIAAGPDGRLWFTQAGSQEIGAVTTAGAVAEFRIPRLEGAASSPGAITAGPDGALWFADRGRDHVARVTTGGTFSLFPAPSGSGLQGITSGPDGALWLTAARNGKIVRMTTAGAFAEFSLPTRGGGPSDVVTGPDGALWFTERLGTGVGRVTTDTPPDALPTGPQGPAGAAGPAGPAGETRLVLIAFQAIPARARAGRKVTVRFAITAGARVSLLVRRGTKGALRTVSRRTVRRAGVSTIAWNGRLGSRRARRGVHELIVRVTDQGRTVSSGLRVRLR